MANLPLMRKNDQNDVSSRYVILNRPNSSPPSGLDDVFHHVSMHISEAEIAALVFVGELLMINPELVEQGGVEVVHVHGILDDIVAVVIGLAVSNAAFKAAA